MRGKIKTQVDTRRNYRKKHYAKPPKKDPYMTIYFFEKHKKEELLAVTSKAMIGDEFIVHGSAGTITEGKCVTKGRIRVYEPKIYFGEQVIGVTKL